MADEQTDVEQTEGLSTIQDSAVDECPSCGNATQAKMPGVPQPVCLECGAVVGTDAEIPSAPGASEDETTSEVESWGAYYSVTNSTEKQVAEAFEHLEAIGDDLYLSAEARLQVAEVYVAAAQENLTDGRPTAVTVAAAVCIGAREVEKPRPSERVAQAAAVEEGRVKHTIRVFQEELNRGYVDLSPRAYVAYLCDDADLSEDVVQRASEHIEQVGDQNRTTGSHPAGVAAAAIYEVAGEAITQREIAAVAGVSKETIRIRLKELRKVTAR